jgi:hypothetical protein
MIGQKRLDTNYKFDFTQWQIDQDNKITDLYAKINSGGGGDIIIDDKIDLTSTHAVQNKVIAQALEDLSTSVNVLTEKDDKLNADSVNAVENSVITANFNTVNASITELQELNPDKIKIAVDETPTSDSTNLITSGGVYNAITVDENLNIDSTNAVENSTITKAINSVNDDIKELQDLNPAKIVITGLDTEPTENSTNLVTSGGVFASIDHFTTDFTERLDTVIPNINSRLTANTDSINALYSLVNSISAGGGSTITTTIFDKSKHEDYYKSIYFWCDVDSWGGEYYDLETVIDPNGLNEPNVCENQYDYTLRLSYDIEWGKNLEVVFSELITVDTSTILETIYYCNANGQDITVELVDSLKDTEAKVLASFDTIKSFYLDDGEILRVLYSVTNISDRATNGSVQGYLRFKLYLGGSNYQFTKINIVNVENNTEGE